MTTSDKPKHKNIPGAVRRFHAGLFVWIIVTFLAAFYPLLMVGCVMVSHAMIKDFREINPGLGNCSLLQDSSGYVCTQGCDYINYRYEFQPPGALPVMVLVDRHEWWNGTLSCFWF